MSSDNEVLSIFESTGALLRGHFVLRSGLHSGHFFQCARVCEHMDRVTRLAEMLIAKLPSRNFTTVLGPAMGGLVIGQEVARQTNSRFIFAEKELAADGSTKLALRRNFQIKPGERILIVEDVITRGGRVQEAIDIIVSKGGIVDAVAVLVDRSEGKTTFTVPCTPLLTLSFPTYPADAVPAELAAIPASKPGS
ncbi:MAG: orotate phosphoribosyltransferase [Verrucomicrobiota bacterium]|nr:orotate phosphoribosyltransferase [Verrucomicrobiota bacterium]